MRIALLVGLVVQSSVALAVPEDVARLWTEEGRTLQRLVEVSEGRELGEVLLRLGTWERDSARRLEEEEGDRAAIERHMDAADAALAAAVERLGPDRSPIALFSLGDLRRSRGQYDEAAPPLEWLVDEFPKAPLAVDAAIALGDDAFEQARLADAVDRYEFAIGRAPPGDAAAWARYKLAWCRINLGEHAEARRLFKEVASRGKGSSLVEEARRDFVIALARDASVEPKQALSEIASIVEDPARRRRFGEGWANLVAESGRDEEAAWTYDRLIPGAPMDEAARMLSASLAIAVRRRDREGVMRIGHRLADVYEARPALEGEARDTGERALRVAAITFHGEGRAAGDEQKLEEAYALYEDYLRAFPGDPHAYDLHHHAGELLLSLKRPKRAERHYTAAVLLDLKRLEAGEPAGKWLASAARGAVVAAQQLVEKEPKRDAPKPAVRQASTSEPPPQPEPLRPSEELLVAACDRYLRALPSGEFAVEVSFQRGLLFYKRHRFEVAVTELRRIAMEHSADEVAPTAAEAALDGLRQLRQWDELAALARELAGRAPIASALGTHLLDVRQAAMLAAAEERAKSGLHDEAARRYLEVAKEFPEGSRLERALYNAASSLAVNGRLDEAVKVRARLIEEKPKGDLTRRALERQVEDLLRLGRFADAQAATLTLAEKLKGDEKAARLHDAVIFAEASGDRSDAERLRERYLREHRRGDDVFVHALELAERTKGCIPSMKAHRRAVRLAPTVADRVVALARTARAEERCNEHWWARKHAGEALALQKKVPGDRPDALDALADAELLRTGEPLEKYRRLSIRMPFQKTIPRKLEALQLAEAALAKVVARGRPEAAICALSESGRAWSELARTLSSVRAPRSFTEEQQMMFEEELASRAQPLADRARTTLEEALRRSRETGLNPPCVAKGVDELARLAPEQFAPRVEVVPTLAPQREPEKGDPAEVLRAAPDAPAAWLVAARRELARRRPHAALLLLERIAEDDPLALEAKRTRLEALRALGRVDTARALLVKLSRDHDLPWATAELADAALAARDFEGARDAVGRLLPVRGDDPAPWIALGVSARALGDPAFAKESFEKALSLDDERPEAHLAIGVLLCGEGNAPKKGLEHLERFDALGGRAPDGLEAQRAACEALANAKGEG